MLHKKKTSSNEFSRAVSNLPACRATQNAKNRVKVLRNTTHQNVNELFIIQLLYLMHISCKAGKAKQIEKRSTGKRLVKEVFYTVRNIKTSNYCVIFVFYSRVICNLRGWM